LEINLIKDKQTTVKSEYHIIGKTDSRQLTKRLAKEGELIEPMKDIWMLEAALKGNIDIQKKMA